MPYVDWGRELTYESRVFTSAVRREIATRRCGRPPPPIIYWIAKVLPTIIITKQGRARSKNFSLLSKNYSKYFSHPLPLKKKKKNILRFNIQDTNALSKKNRIVIETISTIVKITFLFFIQFLKYHPRATL